MVFFIPFGSLNYSLGSCCARVPLASTLDLDSLGGEEIKLVADHGGVGGAWLTDTKAFVSL